MHPYKENLQNELESSYPKKTFFTTIEHNDNWIISVTQKEPLITFSLKLEDFSIEILDEITLYFINFFKKPLPVTLDWVASSLQDQPCFFKVSKEDLELTLEADQLLKKHS